MEIACNNRYLNLPVRSGAPKHVVTLRVAGRLLRKFEIELAESDPQFWVSLDLTPFGGQVAVLDVTPGLGDAVAFPLSDSVPEADALYKESAIDQNRRIARPAFHFTARRGWLNDPNGLVYYDCE